MVKDSIGHAAGDRMLVEVAKRIVSMAGADDVVRGDHEAGHGDGILHLAGRLHDRGADVAAGAAAAVERAAAVLRLRSALSDAEKAQGLSSIHTIYNRRRPGNRTASSLCGTAHPSPPLRGTSPHGERQDACRLFSCRAPQDVVSCGMGAGKG